MWWKINNNNNNKPQNLLKNKIYFNNNRDNYQCVILSYQKAPTKIFKRQDLSKIKRFYFARKVVRDPVKHDQFLKLP